MTQDERRRFLLAALLRERTPSRAPALPPDADGQRLLLRALLNLRPPAPVGQTFLRVQDAYLQEELRRRGITDAAGLRPVRPGLYLWRGDLTTLRCDAIVNAANSRLLGCFCPNHGCVDNAVHTFAGVQLRLACAALFYTRRFRNSKKDGKLYSVITVLLAIMAVIYGGMGLLGLLTYFGIV